MKYILIALMAVMLTSCSTTKDALKDPVQVHDFVIVKPDRTPELALKEVKWQVWNQQKLVAEGTKAANKDKVFFVLTKEELDKLMENLIGVSDVFAKSVNSNIYYSDAIDEYNKTKAKAK